MDPKLPPTGTPRASRTRRVTSTLRTTRTPRTNRTPPMVRTPRTNRTPLTARTPRTSGTPQSSRTQRTTHTSLTPPMLQMASTQRSPQISSEIILPLETKAPEVKVSPEVEASSHICDLELQELIRIHGILVHNKALTSAQCKVFRKKIEASYDVYDQHYGVLLKHVSVGERPPHEISFRKFRSIHEEAMIELESAEEYILESKLSKAVIPVNTPPPVVVHTPLPKPIPSFSGKYEEWQRFKTIFQDVVDKSQESSRMKLYHLEKALCGEASKIIDERTLNEGNYERAWELLSDRYDNKRRLINIHISGLLNLKKQHRETHEDLRLLVETVDSHIDNLKYLGEEFNGLARSIVVFLLSQALHVDTKKLWEATISKDELPCYDKTIKFLKDRVSVLERCIEKSNIATSESANVKAIPQPPQKNLKPKSHALSATVSQKCELCEGAHRNIQCPELSKLNPFQKNERIRAAGICFNCLRKGHRSKDCPSDKTCHKCNRRHHTLLHNEGGNNVPLGFSASDDRRPMIPTEQSPPFNCSSSFANSSRTVFLLTAIVQVYDKWNVPHPCRVLLDSGSQVNFVSEELANRLQLPMKPTNVCITGINAIRTLARDKIEMKIKSRISDFAVNLECLVAPKVTSIIPSSHVNIDLSSLPNGIILADPLFYQPQRVDVLIGAELFFDILKENQLQLAPNLPVLRETQFGWVVSGSIVEPYVTNMSLQHSYKVSVEEVEDMMQHFWQIEEVPNVPKMSKEELACEAHFLSTYKRDEDGRFIVRLPFKEGLLQLNNCRSVALKRFLMLEKRLVRNPDLRAQYTDFVREYELLGHCCEINESEDHPNQAAYYLPHHAVLRPSSTSTKCRVVFDASAKASPSDMSLNDVLQVGPVVQNDLHFIVLRFRTYKVAFSGDVSKMYRQVLHSEEDRRFLRIFWRPHPSQPMRILQLNTVTYGTASAPFLATRCLLQLVEEDGPAFPIASRIVKEETYMDDVLSGADSVEDAIEAQRQLKLLLERGCFPIHKWCSNSNQFLEHIPEEDREKKTPMELRGVNETIKVLGLLWDPDADILFIANNPAPSSTDHHRITKREMYSEIAKFFDPLGLVSPVIVVAKLLAQRMWRLKIGWDDPVDDAMTREWNELQNSLSHLHTIAIPRCVTFDGVMEYELHGFSDASTTAYGACIYLRSLFPDGSAKLQLLTSKSKLAPLHDLSIPRKELCAALLLARLIRKVLPALNMSFRDVVLWCDSTIVLSWIRKPLNQLQLFVRNRIAVIQESTSDHRWEYIRSQDNPADIVSRGQLVEPLKNNNLWWYGPAFLYKSDYEVEPAEFVSEDDLPELMPAVVTSAVSFDDISFLYKFSNFRKTQRIMGYLLRFIGNCRNPPNLRESSPHLTVKELRRSTETMMKLIQQLHFRDEIQRVIANEHCKGLANLRPIYLDGLLRVGGRLDRSLLPFESRHPIIVPSKDPLIHHLIRQMHVELLHVGQTGLMNAMRQRYWLLNARSTIRAITRKCVRCFRVNPTNSNQLMGNLPSTRVVPSPPFAVTGVDYAGPIFIKQGGRRPILIKAYVSVYVCMATKAVHLEPVSDLSADAFLASLKRFIGRRGMIQQLHSDNATNFRGANNELKELFNQFRDQQFVTSVETFCHSREIQWHFIPPDAPEFGGLWEAAVKSTKTHLKRVVGNGRLTFEELTTVLVEIEAVLNSRPLFTISNDPADPLVITPAHYLIGRPLIALAEPSLENVKATRLTRWQHLQLMREHFWRAWSREYLNTLQPRKKNLRTTTNIREGMIVLLHNRNEPPLNWTMGRVTVVYPGKDGLVRAVDVSIGGSTYRRSITKISVLPIEDNAIQPLDL